MSIDPRTKKKYCEILGVSINASKSEIKRAYFEKSRTEHPDKHGNSEEAKTKFQQIKNAYEKLDSNNSNEIESAMIITEQIIITPMAIHQKETATPHAPCVAIILMEVLMKCERGHNIKISRNRGIAFCSNNCYEAFTQRESDYYSNHYNNYRQEAETCSQCNNPISGQGYTDGSRNFCASCAQRAYGKTCTNCKAQENEKKEPPKGGFFENDSPNGDQFSPVENEFTDNPASKPFEEEKTPQEEAKKPQPEQKSPSRTNPPITKIQKSTINEIKQELTNQEEELDID
ncbi:9376_t:CDS:2 [Entrophospora sp. SA101]|nr:9376_t:CDS:2 [Entrophospora sp. SA101]